MQEVYDRDGITLFLGDSQEVLPALGAMRFDLLLTDPPYGIDGGRGGSNRQRGKGKYASPCFEDTAHYVRWTCIPIVQSALAVTDRAIITPGVRGLHQYLSVLPTPADIGCFWTPAGVSYGSWGAVTYHPILYYGKDPRAGKSQVPNGKSVTENPNVQGHPCPKPLNAWKWLMTKGSIPGESVLDPFAGSGTTLVAARELGRRAIGVEIDERYCEIAVNRLAQTAMDLKV